jgi:hypothetical protein
MKSTTLFGAAVAFAFILTLASNGPGTAMGCGATLEGFGRARNASDGEKIATALAIADWERQVRKAFGRQCSHEWSMAQNKATNCEAGMGHIECKVEADPGHR